MAGSSSSVSDEHVAHAEHEEADEREAEAEDLDAAHGVDAVERDIDDARDVAGEQGDSDGDVEQDVRQRCGVHLGEGAQQQVEGKGDEEVSDFICNVYVHRATSFGCRGRAV